MAFAMRATLMCVVLTAFKAAAIGAMNLPPSVAVACTAEPPSKGGAIACRVVQSRHLGVTATANVEQTQNKTGWGSLAVATAGTGASGNTDVAAFGAGFAEAYITAPMISDYAASNLGSLRTLVAQDPQVTAFVEQNEQWVAAQVRAHDPARHGYWAEVGRVRAQQRGLVAGYAAARALPGGAARLSALNATDFRLLALAVELGDIRKAVVPSARPDYARMSTRAFERYVFENTHCSALFKATDTLSEIYASHDTWTTYASMLRLFKTVRIGDTEVMFSGYPGILAGVDDFYQTHEKLVVIETTNSVFNNALFPKGVTPTGTVPYWIRVIVSNRLANDAAGWHALFSQHNSGTYNNQWMVLDYKKFTPGQPLVNDTFVVGEQIPSHYVYADQTAFLARGHWPSYNVPFYPQIYELSGYPAMVKLHGASASYQLAPRASIFRRDAGPVQDLAGMQKIMRENHFGLKGKPDPLAPSPADAIAARGDLFTSATGRTPVAGGAIDSKITSYALAQNMSVVATSGPTHDQQPVFVWSAFDKASKTAPTPHTGQPDAWGFGWVKFTAPSTPGAPQHQRVLG